jgi:GR25 family glycosyltransferase involved in LPS biosynthesis
MEYIPNKDSLGFDICQVTQKTLKELHKICSFIPYAEGFNSSGWIKYHIAHNDLKDSDGGRLYIVRRPPQKMEYKKDFPRAFCINMERRPDRKKDMEEKFAKFGFDVEFFKAVDGKELTLTDEIKHMFRNNNHGYKCGIIGCALSHINLWKQLIESDENEYIIFEDDEEFQDDMKEKISHALAQVDGKEWDILYLGFIIWNDKRDPIKKSLWNNNLPKVTPFDNNFWGGGTGSYIISRSGAKKLLDWIEENGLPSPIDHLARALPNVYRYSTIPHLVYNDYVGPYSNNKDTDIQTDSSSLLQNSSKTCNGVVVANFKGQFGNNLFTYLAARIFAEENRLNFITEFKNDIFTIETNNTFGETPNSLQSYMIDDGSYDRIKNVIPFQGTGYYIFNGYFQNEPYLYRKRDDIKKWLNIDKPPNKKCVIHLRLNDYLYPYRHLVVNRNYYLDCVKKYGDDCITIVCDKLTKQWEKEYFSDLKKQIEELGKTVEYKEQSMKEDLETLINAQSIIASNSTFCFLGAFLSDAKIISFPYTGVDLLKDGTIKKWDNNPILFKQSGDNIVFNTEFSLSIYDYFEGTDLFNKL